MSRDLVFVIRTGLAVMLSACSDGPSAPPPTSRFDAGADAPDAASGECGNGETESDEECDDANLDDFDDCARDCSLTAPFAELDGIVRSLMIDYDVSAGAVAVTRGGKLAYARGFGVMDEAREVPTAPTTRFRIASVSKPITSVAIHRLVEAGAIELDAAVLPLLGATDDEAVDARWVDITVADLLHHTGGWDREESFDPMFRSGAISAALSSPPPADGDQIFRYMLGQPLDFDPGSRYAYSNFGYMLLGRMIERVTASSYEDHVVGDVLAPAGITRMELGHTRPEERPEDEAHYDVDPGAPLVPSVFPDVEDLVPEVDGGFYLEPLAAHGGWIASAVDLCRFMVTIDGFDTAPDRLGDEEREAMVARPSLDEWQGETSYYASGWSVIDAADGGQNWWHTGALPGTTALIVRTASGMTWAALFNRRRSDRGTFEAELDEAMWRGVRSVARWPEADLFQRHP